MTAVICFALAALQMIFIVPNPTGAILHWIGLVFSFGMGIFCAVMESRK